jgi:hypothetical protein
VADPDAGDGYLIAGLEHGPLPPAWEVSVVAGGTKLRIGSPTDPQAGGPPFTPPFQLRYRVRDAGGFLSRWGTVEVGYWDGAVLTAVDDHHLAVPELVFVNGQQSPGGSGGYFAIPQHLLLANDSVEPPTVAVGAFTVLQDTVSCGHATGHAEEGEIRYYPLWQPSQPCLGEVTLDYFLCPISASGHCILGSGPIGTEEWGRATVTLRVREPNQPPVAGDDSYAIQRGVPVYLQVLANDSDPQGQVPILDGIVTPPAHGEALALPDGSVRYQAEAAYVGGDGFAYRIVDDPPEDPPASDVGSVVVRVGRDLVWEDFHNDSTRPQGTPLDGVRVNEGAGEWKATGILVGGDRATTNGTGAGGHAALRLPRIPLSSMNVVAVEAQVTVGAGNWVGAGLTAHEDLSLLAQGTVWVSLTTTGTWQLRRQGPTVVASGPAPLFSADGANTVRVEYDRLSGLGYVWINGVRVLDGFAIGGLEPSALRVAGLQIRHPAGAPAGAMTVDDFTVYYRADPTPVARAVGDDFTPVSTDRTPGWRIDRAWATEGEARWEGERVAFVEGGAVAIDPQGTSLEALIAGRAALPFAPRNVPGAPGLFFESTFTLGAAERMAFGLVRDDLPSFERLSGELWWALERSGSWTLGARLEGRTAILAQGQLPSFDPTVARVLRCEATHSSFAVWLDRTLVASGTTLLPLTLDVRGAGLEIGRLRQSPPTDRVDSFRAGILEEP